MPRLSKLKVYRMPIGFHDAYVAAPSRKAAVEAWGADKDVFSRGQAELVDDPALTAEPLATPSTVIKRLRGTREEQVAALGPADKPAPSKTTKAGPKPKPAPKPSRAKLDVAEREMADIEASHARQLKDLAEREAALARERKELRTRQAEEAKRATQRREEAKAGFDAAMERWRWKDQR